MIYELPIPRVGQTDWLEVPNTLGGQHEPDRWYATKRKPSGVVVVEVEHHNAGVTKGVRGSARPEFSCAVDVRAPAGWTLVADCTRPLPTSWPPMHASMRRYAMYPTNKPELLREATKEASMPYDDVRWPRGRAAYGPCGVPLPNLTPQQVTQESNKVLGWKKTLCAMLASPTGAGPVEDSEDGLQVRKNGWAPWGRHPDGHSTPPRDAPAGSGIRLYTGYEQAPDSPPFSWLKACCNHDRWWHAYDRATGKLITANDYPDPGPAYQAGTGDPNNGHLPEFMGVAQNPDPLPLPYDASHSIRGFRDLIFLSEATDSPGVKRMLRSVAAQLRLQYSDRGPYPTPNYTAPCLRTWRDWARNAPHTGHFGMDTGRMQGWPMLVIAQSVKRAGATENVAWCSMAAEYADTVVMPSGISSRCAHPDPSNVWYDPNHDTAHSFEVPIFWHGAVGCSVQSGRALTHPTRFAECLYEEAPLMPYYTNGHGPPDYAYVAKRGGAPYPTVTAGKVANGGDSTNCLAGCALAAHLNPHDRHRWVAAAHRITSFHDLRESAGIVAQEQMG